MKKLNYLFVLLFAISFLSSCTKDKPLDGFNEEAPELPALNSMMMPFAGFEDADPHGKSGGDEKDNAYYNWIYSATHVVIWNTVLSLNLAIPVASYGEAFKHDPSYIGNGVWEWAYDHDYNGKTYSARLLGQLTDDDEIKWDMYISQAGGFSNVHWFTGLTSTVDEKATWTLSHQPYNPEPFLRMDYENTIAEGSMRATNVIPNSKDNGDYIEFRRYLDAEFDRHYDVYQITQDNLLEIQWNEAKSNGRVKNLKEFGTEDWNCWDGDLKNIDC